MSTNYNIDNTRSAASSSVYLESLPGEGSASTRQRPSYYTIPIDTSNPSVIKTGIQRIEIPQQSNPFAAEQSFPLRGLTPFTKLREQSLQDLKKAELNDRITALYTRLVGTGQPIYQGVQDFLTGALSSKSLSHKQAAIEALQLLLQTTTSPPRHPGRSEEVSDINKKSSLADITMNPKNPTS